MDVLQKLRQEPIIAYFSMEIALSNDIPTYSGGLGILAGDTVRSAADLLLPFVAVTLISRKGYFRQELTPDGWQIEHPMEWEVEKFLTPLPTTVEVEIEKRKVKVRAWLYTLVSVTGGVVPVLFLDTNLPENTPEDQTITDYLYGGDRRYRLKQEIVLGIGGVRFLRALDFEVRKYHINEGHAALATVELLRQEKNFNLEAIRARCVFTTHTPVEAGHDKFHHDLVRAVLGEPIPEALLKQLGGEEYLNMTLLALNLSGYVNGVAKRHSEISRNMFPGYTIHSITNGVHGFTWTSESFRQIFDQYIPGWAHEPGLLVRADVIPDEKIWEAHQNEKRKLLAFVKEKTGIIMDENSITIGFARRMTSYKRPHFIFSDIERLRKVRRKGALQFIFAGKAHPQDFEGKKLIQEIILQSRELQREMKIAFLENYDMEIAQKMLAGVDVWLNTPMRPLEASGTSGMKAAHNGVANFSVLDGWWIEGHLEGITGWSIGPEKEDGRTPQQIFEEEIDDFYHKLEYLILPLYYGRIDWWVKLMKNSIGKIASYFNAHRMMRRYVSEAYFHQPIVNHSFETKEKEP